MSNKQEIVADIVADIRAQNQGLPEDSYALSPLVCDLLSFADRFEAAHKREIAELRECLEQAYGDKIGTYTMKGNEVEWWRKALEGAKDEGK